MLAATSAVDAAAGAACTPGSTAAALAPVPAASFRKPRRLVGFLVTSRALCCTMASANGAFACLGFPSFRPSLDRYEDIRNIDRKLTKGLCRFLSFVFF